VIGRARTFPDASKKLSRALDEFNIQGVKTNIPFLQNVLTHPDFLKGGFSTRFMEEHPELFRFPETYNKAHKMVALLDSTLLSFLFFFFTKKKKIELAIKIDLFFFLIRYAFS